MLLCDQPLSCQKFCTWFPERYIATQLTAAAHPVRVICSPYVSDNPVHVMCNSHCSPPTSVLTVHVRTHSPVFYSPHCSPCYIPTKQPSQCYFATLIAARAVNVIYYPCCTPPPPPMLFCNPHCSQCSQCNLLSLLQPTHPVLFYNHHCIAAKAV